MDVALARDIVIIISGCMFIIALAVVIVIALVISSRAKGLMKTADDIMGKARSAVEDFQVITSYTRQEVALPLAQLAGLIQGLGQSIQSFTQMFKKW